jgi:hypothetical protein
VNVLLSMKVDMMCGRLEGGVDMMYVSVAEGNVGMRCLSGNGF